MHLFDAVSFLYRFFMEVARMKRMHLMTENITASLVLQNAIKY